MEGCDSSVRAEDPVDPGVVAGETARHGTGLADTPVQSPGEICAAVQRSLGAPRLLPDYRLRKCLGHGGYGAVWLAESVADGNRVAIKFFADGTARNWERLLAEVKQLGLLSGDPGIIQVCDADPESAPPYYIMKYAEGGSLADWIARDGPLSACEVVRILREISEALAIVHGKGIRHCDIKPANILLDERRRVLIADFGQAHLAGGACSAFGTFFYMAPEQAEARHQIADTRWDVYGVGAIAYEMLTGEPPYHDAGLIARLNGTPGFGQQLRLYREWIAAEPRPAQHHGVPGVDGELASIIDGCLETDPAKRLRDAGEVLTALLGRDQAPRRRALVPAAVVTLAMILIVAAGFLDRVQVHDAARSWKPIAAALHQHVSEWRKSTVALAPASRAGTQLFSHWIVRCGEPRRWEARCRS
jgi:serine/threonine protein kinase